MTKDKIKLLGIGAGATALAMALHKLESKVNAATNEEQDRGLTISDATPYIMPATHPLSGVKVVKEKEKPAYKPYNTPPRSMTPEELVYYEIHKTLKGFNHGHTKL